MKFIPHVFFLSASAGSGVVWGMATPQSQSHPKIKYSYFDVEANGECVRLALALAGVDYEDNRISFSDWKEFQPQTPFGRVPIMSVDDGPPKSQSGAMLRWVASQFSDTLYPRDKLYEIEEAIGLVQDFQESFRAPLYMQYMPRLFGRPREFGTTDEGKLLIRNMREQWMEEKFPVFCGYMETLLDRNDGMFLASRDHPTIADCIAIPTLRLFTLGTVDHFPVDSLDSFPKLKDYVQRVCGLPQLQGRYTDGLF